jgi:hypothetical protein
MSLQLQDTLYTILHLVIIGFNLLGWMWKRTRRAHLVLVILTALSWFVLGIWYGMGYCPITDWQWDVKRRLGETDLPNSFIKYFADKLTGADIDASIVDGATVLCFTVVFILSIYLNVKHTKR